MNENYRILFITDALGYGGAEKQLTFVAEGLVERGHSVAIANLSHDKRFEEQRKIDNRIKLYTASIKYRNTFQFNVELVTNTIRVAKHFKADIIIGFKHLGFYAVVAGFLLNKPSIISERADPFKTYEKANFLLRVKLWFINHASGGVFQTEQAASFYCKRLRQRSSIIPNPVFIRTPIAENVTSIRPKTVVSLGRFENIQKRFDVMIEAFAMFHKSHPDYILNIYGSGTDETIIRNLIEQSNMTHHIILKGVSTDPILDMSKEGIFLITSDYEGISNSLLEAMACGLPVVSTDHTPGGARLLISNKINGLLVPIGDVHSICEALCMYADNPSFALSCGRNAQYVLDAFSPLRMLDLWENYIKTIILNTKKVTI